MLNTNLIYIKFVFNIYLQPYQTIFLPIKIREIIYKIYANMRLLPYRFFFYGNLKYKIQKYNKLYFKFER